MIIYMYFPVETKILGSCTVLRLRTNSRVCDFFILFGTFLPTPAQNTHLDGGGNRVLVAHLHDLLQQDLRLSGVCFGGVSGIPRSLETHEWKKKTHHAAHRNYKRPRIYHDCSIREIRTPLPRLTLDGYRCPKHQQTSPETLQKYGH